MTKWAAMKWTADVICDKKEDLSREFPLWFLDEGAGLGDLLSVEKDRRTAASFGVTDILELSEHGVFGGLWELGESLGCGLTCILAHIPIRQETVEIANLYDVNPYQLPSEGSLLMAVPDGRKLCEAFEAEGINACVIGRLSDTNDRVVKGSETVRFLDKIR